jgi:hypothetical protein
MAKNVNIQFSGSIGPLVGCVRYGKYYYRGKPDKVQQSAATKQSSNNFGLASKAGKIMRLYLAAAIPNATDGHMHKKLATSINKWLGLVKGLPPQPVKEIPFVNHFNFNPQQLLQEKLRIVISFTQTGPDNYEVQLPAFVPVNDIISPAGATHIEFCISTAALRLGDDTCFGNNSSTITIPYNNTLQPAQQIAMPLQTRPGNILIAALQLRFGVQEAGEINYRKFAGKATAAIVGAVYL